MKQTLEEATREKIHAHYNCNGEYPCGERDYCEHCNGHNTAFDCCECGADKFKEGFIAGAEWHAKQSPWISVEERLPETNDGQSLYEVIVVTSDRRFLVVINTEVEHLVGLLGVTHWMPIPSFDEILEANKDVLERIKEKGD